MHRVMRKSPVCVSLDDRGCRSNVRPDLRRRLSLVGSRRVRVDVGQEEDLEPSSPTSFSVVSGCQNAYSLQCPFVKVVLTFLVLRVQFKVEDLIISHFKIVCFLKNMQNTIVYYITDYYYPFGYINPPKKSE